MRIRRWDRVLIAYLSLLVPIAAVGQLAPAADAFVNSGAPGTNYGDKIMLDVRSARSSLITFDLSALPVGPSVAKATLRLYVDSVNTAGAFNVVAADAWISSSAINGDPANPTVSNSSRSRGIGS
jgi:hypothetical protein